MNTTLKSALSTSSQKLLLTLEQIKKKNRQPKRYPIRLAVIERYKQKLAAFGTYKKQLVFLILPLALFLIYAQFIAVEKYRSESTYVVRDLTTGDTLGVDLGIFGIGGSSKQLDAQIVVHYLESMDMFIQIDERFNLKARYRSSDTDVTERLIWDPAEEDYLHLYRKNLQIVLDESSGITTIAFDSSDPELAHSILQYLLESGESFLNQLNRKRVEKKVDFASYQLEQNKDKLDAAIQVLEAFQNKHHLVDPSADMAIKNEIIGNLEASIVQKTAEYNQLISYMSPDTIEAVKLENLIAELKAALSKKKAELSGTDTTRLNDLLFEYQKLRNDVDFATEVYKKTLVQYEVLRIEAIQESKIFEVVSTPTLPDGHIYPKRIRMTLTAIVLILVGYKIIMLIGAVVKDHKD